MKIFLTLLLLSIVSSNAKSQLAGNYYKKGKDFSYTLTLNPDSTFSIQKRYFEVNATCEGKWKMVAKDTLLLSCYDSKALEGLQRGYLRERETYVQILKKRKVKVDNVIMRKV